MVDVVQEDALVLPAEATLRSVHVVLEHKAAPVPRRRRCGPIGAGVAADRLIKPGRENNVMLRRTQDLKRATATVDSGRGTADADSR